MGQRYQGWQRQSHTELTIQGQLEKALSKIVKSTDIKTIGSGRTDSGVHALGQIARVQIPFAIEGDALMKGLNSLLPQDIECLSCEESSEAFHPIFNAKDKTYRYLFSLGKRRDALTGNLITYISRNLDLDKMRNACLEFVGEHDFSDYFTTGTEVSSTIRTIYNCELRIESGTGFLEEVYPEYIIFEVKGSGFLKQMVRLMVSTVWNVGEGKVSIEELRNSLNSPTGKKLAAVAPPQGLYLCEVNY